MSIKNKLERAAQKAGTGLIIDDYFKSKKGVRSFVPPGVFKDYYEHDLNIVSDDVDYYANLLYDSVNKHSNLDRDITASEFFDAYQDYMGIDYYG